MMDVLKTDWITTKQSILQLTAAKECLKKIPNSFFKLSQADFIQKERFQQWITEYTIRESISNILYYLFSS